MTIAICSIFLGQVVSDRPEPSARIQELAGRWEVSDAQSTNVPNDKSLVPAEVLGLTRKGTEILVKGNELTADGKILATLTTDFSESGLELDSAVFYRRRPVLLTLPNGKGLLCAYEPYGDAGFMLCYPHGMGRVSQGTRLFFARPAK